MAETHVDRIHDEPVMLDIGHGIGALVLYTGAELRGQEIEVSLKGHDARRIHTAIHERRVKGRAIFAGVYPALPVGDYNIWRDGPEPIGTVTIGDGQVAEVDWR